MKETAKYNIDGHHYNSHTQNLFLTFHISQISNIFHFFNFVKNIFFVYFNLH